MANEIIDDDTVKESNYLQPRNHPKHKKAWKQSFSIKIGILFQGSVGCVDGT